MHTRQGANVIYIYIYIQPAASFNDVISVIKWRLFSEFPLKRLLTCLITSNDVESGNLIIYKKKKNEMIKSWKLSIKNSE